MLNSPMYSPNVFESLKIYLPSTSFLPIQGEVTLNRLKIHGMNGMKIRNLNLRSENYAARSELGFDVSINSPRLSILANVESEEFNGEVQIMLVEYNLDIRATAKRMNVTSDVDFEYFRFNKVQFTQTLRNLKINFSNAKPESYGS